MQIILEKKLYIRDLVTLLKKGGVIAMPTETAYGLIALATSPQAVKKIYLIKGRVQNKSLPMIASSLYQVRRFFKFPKITNISFLNLSKKYWPGPLSLQLLGKSKKIAVPAQAGSFVVRVSSKKILRDLARLAGAPLTATSANFAGQGEIYDAKILIKTFKNKKHTPDITIDGGKINTKKPSTIVGVENGNAVILRQGEIRIKL
jgi:L-threonylcarbamoyladenylate synthase